MMLHRLGTRKPRERSPRQDMGASEVAALPFPARVKPHRTPFPVADRTEPAGRSPLAYTLVRPAAETGAAKHRTTCPHGPVCLLAVGQSFGETAMLRGALEREGGLVLQKEQFCRIILIERCRCHP